MAGGGPIRWDPAVYERYKTYRDRPALDLMLRLPRDLRPREIWDLGCGTGEQAAVLKRRHPAAEVHGLDLSLEMLAEALGPGPTRPTGLKATSPPSIPRSHLDLIFTNAALHRLPDHAELFPRLAGMLRRRAASSPVRCRCRASRPSWHVAMRETAADGPWAARLGAVRGVRPAGRAGGHLLPPAGAPGRGRRHLEHRLSARVLEGEDPVVDWMRGTGLRPFRQALEGPGEEAAFLGAHRARLARLFPPRADGVTLLPFPRLLIVARR